VALVTAVLAYPNPYTRTNTSELIYLLFSRCGVADEGGLCDYVDRYLIVYSKNIKRIMLCMPVTQHNEINKLSW